MNKLKKQIIWYFILCAFGSAVVDSIFESLFNDILMPMVAMDSKRTGIFLVLQFLVIIIIFVLFAFLFYRLMNQAILRESKRQVEERNMLYSCITHDLKTPMTSVLGFAAALREGKVEPKEQKDIYDIIYNKSCYMKDLLDTMFTYSKLCNEEYHISCSKMDICALVRETVAMLYDEFEKKDMELQLEISEERILCEIDEKEMKRVISNLLINACKHNENGTRILVKVEKQKETIAVIVADSGNPFTKEEKESIFKPFYKGDESRLSGEGNGLGLAISQLIIQKHGGQLKIEDNLNGYSKGFVVKL